MRRFYEINSTLQCSDEADVWDEEQDADWNGCCEDPYDDEDEEENEREWCD